MSGSTYTTQPQFHFNNIFASPTTSLLGLGALISGAGSTLAATGVPQNGAGWIGFGISMLTGILGLLSK